MARAEQAPPDDDRRLAQDGRLRRHDQRAGPRLRLGRDASKDPTTFGEYKLTYRTGDIVSPHLEVAEPLRLELEDFARAILTGSTPRSSREVGLDVVRMIEAVDDSLELDGAKVEVGAERSSGVTVCRGWDDDLESCPGR